jgi:hypothetical protein
MNLYDAINNMSTQQGIEGMKNNASLNQSSATEQQNRYQEAVKQPYVLGQAQAAINSSNASTQNTIQKTVNDNPNSAVGAANLAYKNAQITSELAPPAQTAAQAKAEAVKQDNNTKLQLLNTRLQALGANIESPDMPQPWNALDRGIHDAVRASYQPNTTEAAFNSNIQALKLLVPQILDGAGKRLSNVEIEAVENSLPAVNDSLEVKRAKYNTVMSQLSNRFSVDNGTQTALPVSNYTHTTGGVPDLAIRALRQHPEHAADFEAKYGVKASSFLNINGSAG